MVRAFSWSMHLGFALTSPARTWLGAWALQKGSLARIRIRAREEEKAGSPVGRITASRKRQPVWSATQTHRTLAVIHISLFLISDDCPFPHRNLSIRTIETRKRTMTLFWWTITKATRKPHLRKRPRAAATSIHSTIKCLKKMWKNRTS